MNRPSDADQYPQLRDRGILIVDDDIMNREILRELLTKFGVSVTCAVNGADAVRLTTLDRYDLIVMDVQMPVMDGVEATRCIRKSPQNGDVPILAFTSAGASVREDCLAAGMDDFLPKPFALDDLVKAIERWISDYRHTTPRLWFRDASNAGV